MGAEVLNQDEIDALLKGVNNGEVPTEAAGSGAASVEVKPYDLATQEHLVRGRMPTLEMINDRLSRQARVGLYGMLRRTPEINIAPIKVIKFSQYLQNVQMPASLNLVKFNPLRGMSLVTFDARLVFALVDNFFGGSGRSAKIEGREFTRTEARVVQMVLKLVFSAVQEAWAPLMPLQPEYLSTEMNPNFATIVGAADHVVVSGFRIDLDNSGGDMHIVIPYAALEPMREMLTSRFQGDRSEQDEAWAQALREELEEAEVDVVPILGHAQLSVGRLVDLKPGDIIPCDFEGQVTLLAEGLPVLRGTYGSSRGQQAVKITNRLTRRRKSPTPISVASKP